MDIEDVSGGTVEVYIELADVSGDKIVTKFPLMRLCRALEVALEGKFLDHIRRKVITLGTLIARRLGTAAAAVQTAADWHSQTLIEELCDLAIDDENCFFMFEDTWLKMTVSLRNPRRFFGNLFRKDELTKSITIRRNVVPREGYLKKLQELRWPREFYSRKVLQDSRGRSLMQILKEQRKSGNRSCELARVLAVPRRPSANRKPVFHNVSFGDVVQVRKLGKGSGGMVWEVVWRKCSYAMKTYESEKGSFEIEKTFAESPLSLHPHIVQVFGGSKPGEGESEAKPCLLMELLDDTLERFLYQSFRRRIPFTSRRRISRVEKLDLLLPIASAMQKLHQNRVVHGDLKLANILISTFEVSGNVRHLLAKVADFDTAMEIKPSAVEIAPRNGGSKRYASPELLKFWNGGQDKANCRVDCKSDVYSFGVMAYEILTEHWAYDLKILTKEELSDDTDDNDNKKINIAEISRDERKLYAAGEKQLIDCTAWRDLKKSRIDSIYFQEVIPIVENCLKSKPEDRPNFSEILKDLTISKSKLQAREKRNAAKQKNLIRQFVCLFVFSAVLVSLLHYGRIYATSFVVTLVTLACFTGNWPCFKFLTTFLAQILI